MPTDSPLIALAVPEVVLGTVLEAAREHARYLQLRAHVSDDAPHGARTGVEPLLGHRNREAACSEAQEIMQAARHIASLVRR